jgi:FKBP-type peptidyl-prolyl cis-trans isomerase
MTSIVKRLILPLSLLVALVTFTSCNETASNDVKTPYRVENEKYIEDLANNPEYQELSFAHSPFSVYYQVIKGPEGDEEDLQRPLQNSQVQISYSLSLISGEKVEDDQEHTFWIYHQEPNKQPETLVRGMQLALQYMSIGEEWKVVIPWQLGYGGYSRNQIPAFSTLIFEVKLIDIPQL